MRLSLRRQRAERSAQTLFAEEMRKHATCTAVPISSANAYNRWTPPGATNVSHRVDDRPAVGRITRNGRTVPKSQSCAMLQLLRSTLTDWCLRCETPTTRCRQSRKSHLSMSIPRKRGATSAAANKSLQNRKRTSSHLIDFRRARLPLLCRLSACSISKRWQTLSRAARP